MKSVDFDKTLEKAIHGDEKATQYIIDKYLPLIRKNSIVDGVFDEDCMQYILMRFILELRKFKL